MSTIIRHAMLKRVRVWPRWHYVGYISLVLRCRYFLP